MAKYLVTGSNGYIGKHICEEMNKRNLDFIKADYQRNCEDKNFVECDIFNIEENLYEKLGKPEVLLHLAWRNGFVHNAATHMEDLSSHIKFIHYMIEKGVKQICVMGTMHEVGYFEGEICENSPTNPLSQYGISKNALRKSLELYCEEKGVVYQWVRAFYIYGDDAGGNSIFAKLTKAEKEGKEKFPFTSGKNKFDFISVDELAHQIVSVICQTRINGIINCCSGTPISLAQQVESYIKNHNMKITLEYGAFPDRAYDSPAIWGNDEKIKDILSKE